MSLILTGRVFLKEEREREKKKKYIEEVGRKIILALQQDKRSK